MEDEVHNNKREYCSYLPGPLSGVERIPRGTRRNKTGQENNPRGKEREISLERHICPRRKKRVWRELVQKEIREKWQSRGQWLEFPPMSKKDFQGL